MKFHGRGDAVHLHEPRINQDAKSEWRFLAARETDTKIYASEKERFYLRFLRIEILNPRRIYMYTHMHTYMHTHI